MTAKAVKMTKIGTIRIRKADLKDGEIYENSRGHIRKILTIGHCLNEVNARIPDKKSLVCVVVGGPERGKLKSMTIKGFVAWANKLFS